MTETLHRIALSGTARPLVEPGDDLALGDPVARLVRARTVTRLSVARRLRLPAEIAGEHILPRRGERIRRGAVIARGPDGRDARSPVEGFFLWYSSSSGTAVIAAVDDAETVAAPVHGRVAEIEDRWIDVAVPGACLTGIDGSGEPVRGDLAIAVDAPEDELRPGHIDARARGRILVGGSRVSPEALSRARAMTAAGVVVGGVGDKELRDFLATEERRLAAVRAAGHDGPGAAGAFGILVLEGYGRASVPDSLFAWLRGHDGHAAVLLGSEHRLYVEGAGPAPAPSVPARPGDEVTAHRLPHLGTSGRLISEIGALRATGAGIPARTAVVRLTDGTLATVAMANLEGVVRDGRSARDR